MFGEKYGDIVRVVSFDKESVEFCGGTHIENTAKIGNFIITKQSSVSSGVRRIEAICGKSANKYIQDILSKYQEAKFELKNDNIIEGILKLKENIKDIKAKLKNNNSNKELKVSKIKDLTIIIEQINEGDLKEIIDAQKNKYENIVIVLFQANGSNAKIACSCKNTNIKANLLIKEISPILNARGGGKDSFATAGGGDASKIDNAKIEVLKYIENNY
jgi:alanyl-tRNA synthetase